MTTGTIEAQQCRLYAELAPPEVPLLSWWRQVRPEATLFVAEGFEQRGFGVLKQLHRAGIRIPQVILGRYSPGLANNDRYRTDFESLSRAVSKQSPQIIENKDDGSWISEGLSLLQAEEVVLDISALSNRGLFGALDVLRNTSLRAALCYSEAASYWPTREAWAAFRQKFDSAAQPEIGPEFDLQPYLYGGEHRILLVPNHEGYDTPGAKLALVAFLPFKASRLAAILSWAEYTKYILIAGEPRLKKNFWRVQVLKDVNAKQAYGKAILQMPTFGYIDSLMELVAIIEREHVLEECDIHLSPIGSKLQNVACWILSSLIPSITVVLSVPRKYYSEAYSDGIGRSWAFRFNKPGKIQRQPAIPRATADAAGPDMST